MIIERCMMQQKSTSMDFRKELKNILIRKYIDTIVGRILDSCQSS